MQQPNALADARSAALPLAADPGRRVFAPPISTPGYNLADSTLREQAEAALAQVCALLPASAAEVLLFDAAAATASRLATLPGGLQRPDAPAIVLHPESWSPEYRAGELYAGDAPPDWLPTSFGAARAIISVPLLSSGWYLGALNVQAIHPSEIAPRTLVLLGDIAYSTAIAIHNRLLVQQAEQDRAQLQLLSRRLLAAQENERRSVARELHDSIGQTLTAVQISIECLRRDGCPQPEERLADCIDLIERAIEQVRSISFDLRPALLDDLGLVSAIHWFAERQAQRNGLSINFQFDGPTGRLPDELETALFRIAQEALTNVARHARARKVEVTLRQDANSLQLAVRDDGAGFEPTLVGAAGQEGRLGLLGMCERAELVGGRVVVESAPGQGTIVQAEFPLVW